MQLNTDKNLSRRIVLVTSRKIYQEVTNSILNLNDKEKIPIEAFDGQHFTKLLVGKNYKVGDFEGDILAQDILVRPIEEATRQRLRYSKT
jgi:hypothetical protein